MTAAARFAANDLPDFLNECAVVYLPEMGHLIAIKEWEPDCNPEQLQDLGFQFMVGKIILARCESRLYSVLLSVSVEGDDSLQESLVRR